MRSRRIRVLAAGLVIASWEIDAGAADAGQPITQPELGALFGVSHREVGRTVSGQAWTIDVGAGGALSLSVGSFHDAGHATFQGNTLCITWTHANNGVEKCWHYTRLGPNLYASFGPDNRQDSTFQIEK